MKLHTHASSLICVTYIFIIQLQGQMFYMVFACPGHCYRLLCNGLSMSVKCAVLLFLSWVFLLVSGCSCVCDHIPTFNIFLKEKGTWPSPVSPNWGDLWGLAPAYISDLSQLNIPQPEVLWTKRSRNWVILRPEETSVLKLWLLSVLSLMFLCFI